MKRLILLLVILFTSFTSFSNVKIDSSTALPNTIAATSPKSDTDSYIGQLKAIRFATGKVLNNGYDVVVQQQRMLAYKYLFVGIASLLFYIGFFIYYSRITKQKPNAVLPALVCLICALWTTSSFVENYNLIFQGIFNPDYSAIKDIFSIVKGSSR